MFFLRMSLRLNHVRIRITISWPGRVQVSYPVRQSGFLINCKTIVTILNVKVCFSAYFNCKI